MHCLGSSIHLWQMNCLLHLNCFCTQLYMMNKRISKDWNGCNMWTFFLINRHLTILFSVTEMQRMCKWEILPEPQGPWGGADLRFLSPQPDTSLHCETTDTKLLYHMVCPFTPQFLPLLIAPIHGWPGCVTHVAGYIPRWLSLTSLQTITYPSTNRARCRVTLLIETKALPLSQTANQKMQRMQHIMYQHT